ncbi:SpoIID/LytB domain-containing protein [Bacillus pseudomycoides]|uniref:SpoIID/LytB domain-containing protein n=5 Tax=Bacillus TaxID=1386 RepID=UPI0001A13C05|nr:SpoIID/LytB domain-containing protein [Bacillus pseudomycoides]EEM02684.1 hypothetical protein bmyco0002_49290 [Bacillus pseudomycoides]KFN11619.1 stage II sporulation family protein [Bacillus pseudomycoides]MBD5799475.1 hypothetical protein [Bacillus pseudomycoides]MED1478354.1 SpoIID/LytB domain-containing protein [Bacillus pseudomycoides]MED1539223.1 SpoIID/LytB domain-containing protein [Bacillus pseudomycoides]
MGKFVTKTTLAFVLLLSIFLGGINEVKVVAASNEGALQPLEEMINNINKKQLSEIPNLWTDDRTKLLADFLNNQENQEKHIGLFNLKNGRIISTKEIPTQFKSQFPTQKDDSLLYYVAIDYQVHQEDEFFINGINYFLVEVQQEQGKWKIAQIADAPVNIITSNGLGFNTQDEKEMQTIIEQRYKGKFVNRQFKTLKTIQTEEKRLFNQKDSKPLTVEAAKAKLGITDNSVSVTLDSEHKEPGLISVYLTNPENQRDYGCSGCVRNIAFNYYVENVLPNEWRSEWHIASLRTGAIVVKMYGWYAVYHHLAGSVGAAIFDDTRSQVFKSDSATSRAVQACLDVMGQGIHRKDNQSLFLTEYRAGAVGNAGIKASGRVSQNGSNYLANIGWLPYEILKYYYNDSDKVGGVGKEYQFFVY